LIAAEVFGPSLVREDVTLGDAHTRFMGPEVLRLQELNGMGRGGRQLELGREVKCALDVQLDRNRRRARRHRPGAEALQLDVEAIREQAVPCDGERPRERRVVHQQRLTDVPKVCARKRHESVGADLAEPRLNNLGAAPVPIRAIPARQKLAKVQITRAGLT